MSATCAPVRKVRPKDTPYTLHLRWFLAMLTMASSLAGQTLPNGVASGDVDHTSAVLWARGTRIGPARFEFSLQPDLSTSSTVETEITDVMVPVKVDIAISPGQTYYYRFTDTAGVSGTGRFRSPHQEGYHGFRFGFCGDWRGDLRPYPSVSNVVSSDLDLLIALGDSVYADIASPAVPADQARTLDEFRLKNNEVYSERFGVNTWADIRSTTPMLSTIDDHEVTNDFTGGAPPASDPRFDLNGNFINETNLYRDGMQAFNEYNPIRDELFGETGNPRISGKIKLYRHRRYGKDAALMMLDARSFRDDSPPLLEHPPTLWEFQGYQANAYDSSRTMLGEPQLEMLRADLLAAQADGVTWKFVFVPEPIQNLGPIIGSDRFEGYAHERAELLAFIEDNDIENVVFLTADIHGTIINNVVFRTSPGGPQHLTNTFEVTTVPVAFYKPLGPATIEHAPPLLRATFNGLNNEGRDDLAWDVLNGLLAIYGFPATGLQGSPIDAHLLEGKYLAVNWYGWAKVEIDAESQRLTVTVYGIDWYSPEQITADPAGVMGMTPQVLSRFVVSPKGAFAPPTPRPAYCGVLGAVPLFGLLAALTLASVRRRRLP